MFFIKFGKKEHLEQLKSGIVHFSRLEVFQNDPTSFRGDDMEGRVFIDTNKPFLIDGIDISKYAESITLSYNLICEDGSECIPLSFSAAKLSKKNCHKLSDEVYTINADFLAEMKQFGDSFLVFNGYEFMDSIKRTFEQAPCDYEFHPISYINKHDYQKVQLYFNELSEETKPFGHLFLKDVSYVLQSEWRIIAFDTRHLYQLDQSGSVNIQTDFRTNMPILETNLLHTLQCSKDFLFD